MSKRIRTFHRWTSLVFVATVIVCFVVIALGSSAQWVLYTPLPPLFLLMFSGLYLFALPYAAKRRGRRAVTDAS
ncbi:hypothetical protein ACIQUM_30515 [Amycolatopsis azurea]|uniref:hypothetical protein n=1 Tax=Amycolatopsis azurea TaxID=36819 RepID=UPI0037F13F38